MQPSKVRRIRDTLGKEADRMLFNLEANLDKRSMRVKALLSFSSTVVSDRFPLLDSESYDSHVSRALARELCGEEDKGFDESMGKILLANGTQDDYYGVISLEITTVDPRAESRTWKNDFIVSNIEGVDMILGIDWLECVNPNID